MQRPRPLALAALLVAAGALAGLATSLATSAPAAAALATAAAPLGAATPTPELTLFGEALCPDTASWVTKTLAPLLDAGVVGAAPGALATFRFVGWGNAGAGPTPACQHGAPECALNRRLNCAQAVAPAPGAFAAALVCFFSARPLSDAGLDACLLASPIPAPAVAACAAGADGRALEVAAGAETAALAPAHTFVPWVVLGATPLGARCGAAAAAVCDAAAGRGVALLPAACAAAAAAPAAACPGAPRVLG